MHRFGRGAVSHCASAQFQHDGNHFRIGFGRTDMPEALERLEQFLMRRKRH